MTAHLRYQEVVMDIRFPHIFGISLIAVLLATALAFFVRPAFTRDSEFRPPPERCDDGYPGHQDTGQPS